MKSASVPWKCFWPYLRRLSQLSLLDCVQFHLRPPEARCLGIRVVSFSPGHPPAQKIHTLEHPCWPWPIWFLLWFPVSDKGTRTGELTKIHSFILQLSSNPHTQTGGQAAKQTDWDAGTRRNTHAIPHCDFWPPSHHLSWQSYISVLRRGTHTVCQLRCVHCLLLPRPLKRPVLVTVLMVIRCYIDCDMSGLGACWDTTVQPEGPEKAKIVSGCEKLDLEATTHRAIWLDQRVLCPVRTPDGLTD